MDEFLDLMAVRLRTQELTRTAIWIYTQSYGAHTSPL